MCMCGCLSLSLCVRVCVRACVRARGWCSYEVHPYYDDFSSPTFDGLHSIIKGGSWISIGCNGATKDSRYVLHARTVRVIIVIISCSGV